MKALETGFDIVKTLVTGGPSAAWEVIKEKLNDLKEMVLSAIIDFVKSKVIEEAIKKLVSMLSPAGAFIQAIIATMGGRMLPARGAVPVYKAGELVGAIGGSGATAEQDEQCAQAGAATL
jgi:hypothetical protein